MGFKILFQSCKMLNLVDKYKSIFWESEGNVETLQKFSPYIRVFYKKTRIKRFRRNVSTFPKKTLKLFKNVFDISGFPINLF